MPEKPNTIVAMRALLYRVNHELIDKIDHAKLCTGTCVGCSKKLIEYLHLEVESWEARLDAGGTPTFGEMESFEKRCEKITLAMRKNNLILA